MELYDDRITEKKSKIPAVIGITILILVMLTILVIMGIIYLKASITTVSVDDVRNTKIEEIFYIETNEDGTKQLYIPILQISQHLGYNGFNGDYKDKSEDKTKCHVEDINGNETAMFMKDSNILVKATKDSEVEYVTLDKPVFEKDGMLYTTVDGLQKAFNVLFTSDEKLKNIKIYSMDYLVTYYATALKLEENLIEFSTEFSDKKAIFENMIVIKNNGQFGVINASTGKAVLEAKYEDIKYLPAKKFFLVKTNGKYGVVDKEAKPQVKTMYDEIKTMDNQKGLYLVRQNDSYGVINEKGQVVIAPEYRQIGVNIDRYTQNGVDNKYILLDEIIPIKNDKDLWGFFNVKGEKITDFKYSGVGCESTPISNSYPALVIPSNKIIVVKNDKFYNLMTINGEELIPVNVLDTVYFKFDTETEQNKFFMKANNNTRPIDVGDWLTSIGR